MKSIIIKWMAILTVAGFASIANAISIQGTFSGTWDQTPDIIGAPLGMTITSQISTGTDMFDIEGFFDWSCGSVFVCSGRELFNGTLDGEILQVAGYLLIDPIGLELSTYEAVVAPDGDSMDGTFPATGGAGGWEVQRVHTVPIPAAAWLFCSALFGLGMVKRLKA